MLVSYFAKRTTMSARGRFWAVLLGAFVLGLFMYQSLYKPSPADLKVNARLAKAKIDGIRRCVEAVDKQVPAYAREKAIDLRSKCFELGAP